MNVLADLPSVLNGYTPRPGVYDEMVAPNGEVRPQWRQFVDQLGQIGPEELGRRWQRSQRQIVNDGITFNPHDVTGGASRPWVLDAIPLLIVNAEWQAVASGLRQRARLLELMLRDLHGPQHLIRDRLLPPEILFAHPGYNLAYHGLNPPGRRHLDMYAADLARSPDGRWWVMGDRTRAPFGLGYALENRIVTSRMHPAIFRSSRAERLASFFIALRERMRELAPRFRDNPRIVLWTPGPSSASYFEDAYLARYLGYTLVEGGDLAVREDTVMLKTLGGLLPVEVLFRRLNDDDMDPVELQPDSARGVSGLLEVIRHGKVAVSNPPGTQLVDSPSLLAYLTPVCRHLLGEDLEIPSVATWWCGEKHTLKYVLDHLDTLMIRPAFRINMENMEDDSPVQPALLSRAERSELVDKLKAHPWKYVGQELVTRSAAPVWTNDGPAAWYLALRGFLVSRDDDYTVMPGGLARVSPDASVLDHTMTSGERSQDVWILSEGPIEEVTLLAPAGQPIDLRRGGAELPSRVADSLFWLGRHVERAEGLARLLRTVFRRMTGETQHSPELPLLLRALAEQGQIEPAYVVAGLDKPLPNVEDVLPEAIFDTHERRSLRSTIEQAVRLASIVRDRISSDGWRIIHRIDEASRRPGRRRTIDASEVLAILDDLLTDLLAFAGMVEESMTRTHSWRFLDLGRRIERGLQTTTLLRSTLTRPHEDERLVLEAVIQTADSIMTYRSRYLATVQPEPVLDLLLTDDTNPRSIGFQLAMLSAHVDRLPRHEQQAIRGPEQRLALSLLNAVQLADVTELCLVGPTGERVALQRLLNRVSEELPKLSEAVSSRFLIHAGLPRHFAARTTEPQ